MTQQQYTVAEFATRIKEKYPAYADMNDQELVDKIVSKYPQYGEQIKKKDDTESVSEVGSLEPPVVEETVAVQEEQPRTEQDQFFDMALEAVTPELIDRGDENRVAVELNQLLNQYGFDVETAGFLTDALKVTAKNGQSISVDLDPFRTSTEVAESDKLRQFLVDNRRESENILKQQGDYQSAQLQFANEKQIEENVARLNQEANDFQQFTREVGEVTDAFNKKYADLEKYTEEYLRANPNEIDAYNARIEEYNQDLAGIQEMQSQMGARAEELLYADQEINRAAGQYFDTKSQFMLSDVGGLVKRAFAEGSARIGRGMVDFLVDIGQPGRRIDMMSERDTEDYKEQFLATARDMGVVGIPEEGGMSWVDGVSDALRNDVEQKMLDDYAKAIKFGGEDLEKMVGFSESAKEFIGEEGLGQEVFDGIKWAFGESEPDYAYDLAKEGWWGGALLGAIESIPAFVGLGKSAVGQALGAGTRLARLYTQTSDHVDEEFRRDPELREVSEKDKLKLKVPLSLTVAALEEVGFRNVLESKGVGSYILLKAIGKSTERAAGRTFREVIQREVNNALGRGLITLGAGGAAEFETGAVQQVADIGMKGLWNTFSDNPDLNTPESFVDGVKDVLSAGLQEAVGAGLLGAPTAIGAAVGSGRDFSTLSNAELAAFEWMSDPGNRGATKPMLAAHLKNLVNQGKLTGAEAKRALDGYERTSQAMDGIRGVEGLSPKQKKAYLAMEIRRRELEQQLDGRAAPFKKAIQQEIDDLGIRQQELADAVQEQSTEKVSPRDETEAGPEVGGKVQDDKKAPEKKGVVDRMRDRLKQRRVRKSKAEYDKALTRVAGLEEQGATEEELSLAKSDANRARIDYLRNTLTEEQAAQESELDNERERLWEEYQKALGTEQEAEAEAAWFESTKKLDAFFDGVESGPTQEAAPVEETAPEVEAVPEEATPEAETAPELTEEERAEAEALEAQFGAEGTPDVTETTDDGVNVRTREGSKLTKKQQRYVEQANNVLKALQSVIPDIKVVAYQTTEQYREATGRRGSGVYFDKTIHINLAKANSRTAFHEAFHAIFLEQIKDGDPEAQRKAKVLLKTIRKAIPPKSVLASRIDNFLTQYEEQDISEEALSEVFGYIAGGYSALGPQAKSKIKAAVKKLIEGVIGRKLGPQWSQGDQAVLDAMQLLAGKVERGEAITEEELGGIEVSEEAASKEEAEAEVDRSIGAIQKLRKDALSAANDVLGPLAEKVTKTDKSRETLRKLVKRVDDKKLKSIEKKMRDVKKSTKMSEADKAERIASLQRDAEAEMERLAKEREAVAKEAETALEKLAPIEEKQEKESKLADIKKRQKEITEQLAKDKREAKKTFEGEELKEYVANLVAEAEVKRAALRDEIAELRGEKEKATVEKPKPKKTTRKKLDADTYLFDHPDGKFILRRNRRGTYEAYETDNVSGISTDTSWNQSFKTIKAAIAWADKQGANRAEKIKEQQDFLKSKQRGRKAARAADAKAMLTKFRAELKESEKELARQEETEAESEVTDRLRDLIEVQKETVARLEAEVAEAVEVEEKAKKPVTKKKPPAVKKKFVGRPEMTEEQRKRAEVEGVSVEEMAEREAAVELQRKDALSREAKRELDGLKGKTDKESKAKRAELKEFMSNLGTMSVDEAQAKRTEGKLKAREQRASEFSDERIEELGERGIMSHFTQAATKAFRKGGGSLKYYGDGVYFTNDIAYANQFLDSYTGTVVFVDTNGMRLLDSKEAFQREVTPEELKQIVSTVLSTAPPRSVKAYNTRQLLRPGSNELLDIAGRIFDNPEIVDGKVIVDMNMTRLPLNLFSVQRDLMDFMRKFRGLGVTDRTVGHYVTPVFNSVYPEYQGIKNVGLSDVVIWDYDAINENIVSDVSPEMGVEVKAPKAREQRASEVLGRYKFRPDGSLIGDGRLANELRGYMRKFGFGVEQFGERDDRYYIVDERGRRVKPKDVIASDEAFIAEREAIEAEQREADIQRAEAEDLRSEGLKKYQEEYLDFPEGMIPPSRLSAREQRSDLGDSTEGFSTSAVVKFAKERGYSDKVILAVRPGAQQAIDEYDAKAARVNREIQGIIQRTRERVRGEASIQAITNKGARAKAVNDRIEEAVLEYLRGSKFYKDASDVGREAMEINVKRQMGRRIKSSPKPGTILDAPKDKTFTVKEKDALRQKIRDMARSSRNTAAAIAEARRELAKDVARLRKAGALTPTQAVALLSRMARTNPLNEASVNSFVEYAAKVFENANYAAEMNALNKLRKRAADNAEKKLGIVEFIDAIRVITSMKAEAVPEEVLPEYKEVIEELGERKAVLNLEERAALRAKLETILDAIEQELNAKDELLAEFENFEDKVREDGKVSIAKTIKAMVEAGVIEEKEAELLKKYSRELFPEPEGVDEESLKNARNEEKARLLTVVEATGQLPNTFGTRPERNLVNQLNALIRTEGVNSLDNAELKNLLRVINNIENGFLPHMAEVLVEKIDAENRRMQVMESVFNDKSGLSRFLDAMLPGKLKRRARREPRRYIDQVLGNFQGTPVFDAVYKDLAEAAAKYRSDLESINARMSTLEDKLFKALGRDPNKITRAKFLTGALLMQKEFEASGDIPGVFSAVDLLDATIKKRVITGPGYSKASKAVLQSIRDEIDGKSAAEIEAMIREEKGGEQMMAVAEEIRKINDELTPKAQYVASVLRGVKFVPFSQYFHRIVLTPEGSQRQIFGDASLRDVLAGRVALQPSTKAVNIQERQGGEPMAVSFDPFASVNRGAKEVLADFHLTKPVRTNKRLVKKLNEVDFDPTPRQRTMLEILIGGSNTAIEDLLVEVANQSTLASQAFNFIRKQGYRQALGSPRRMVAETLANTFYATFVDHDAFLRGQKYRQIYRKDGANIMRNTNSMQITRLFPGGQGEGLSSMGLDQVSASMSPTRAEIRGGVLNMAQKAVNQTAVRLFRLQANAADKIITTPDAFINKPIWFGTFAREFETLTGEQVDFGKIADGDVAYSEKHAVAIEKAKVKADDASIKAGATDNTVLGMERASIRPDRTAIENMAAVLDNYLTRFLVFEYITSRTAVKAMMGNGMISRKEGVRLMAGVMARMYVYQLAGKYIADFIAAMLYGDDDELEEKGFAERSLLAIKQSIASLVLGGTRGQFVRGIRSTFLELANRDILMENPEEYSYDKRIQVPLIDINQQTQWDKKILDAGQRYMGPFSLPFMTLRQIGKEQIGPALGIQKERKDADREAQEDMRSIMLLMSAGGVLPLSTEVKSQVQRWMYKDLDKEESKVIRTR